MVETSVTQIAKRHCLVYGYCVCQNSALATPECTKVYCTSFLLIAVCSKWHGQITINLRKLEDIWLLVAGKNPSRGNNNEGARESTVSLYTVTIHAIHKTNT